MTNETNPNVLVTTDWVAEHLNDPKVRIVEINEDPNIYGTGHIPNAIHWHPNWRDYLARDYLIGNRMAYLAGTLLSIDEGITVVFYGADHNWWAGFAFWLFDRFGHPDCRIMDGGREKWIAEERPLDTHVPNLPRTAYNIKTSKQDDTHFRADADEVITHIENGGVILDVRSAQEYTGEVVFVPSAFENMMFPRRGHIPTAQHMHWRRALNPDGTFKTTEELRTIFEEVGVDWEQEVFTYCSVGERSGHTWFVLKHLLNHPQVRNYDASWVEWGSREELPRAKGDQPGEWSK